MPYESWIAGDPRFPALRPARYYLVDRHGEVKCAYREPLAGDVDEWLSVGNLHVVLGDTLQEYHWMICARPNIEPSVSSKVLITGLRPLDRGEIPFDPGCVISACEARIMWKRRQLEAADRAKKQAEDEEMDRFRESLQQLSSPVDATWEFELDGWVVKGLDGMVLGRGKVRHYGIDVYRRLLAIMCERFGPECCSLKEKITPPQLMRFYSD